jgi:hypothetical protein
MKIAVPSAASTACRGKLVWQSFSQNGLALSSDCPHSELIPSEVNLQPEEK